MNHEEIGKQAVELGYDGCGIWACLGLLKEGRAWKRPNQTDEACEWLWPDFSYPETEGAALAWIAEKTRASRCYICRDGFERFVLRFEDRAGDFVRDWIVSNSAAKVILEAIKSLNLGKKDNSPMGLNKRLLEVGFMRGECVWGHKECSRYLAYHVDRLMIEEGHFPVGSHPSTIGVATAWLRSFEKIGDSFHVYWRNKQWFACLNGDTMLLDAGHDSELEALVEFAEWAKEEGLMEK